MRVIREMLSDIESKTFDIGFVGEKNHTCVMINCVSLFKQYPDAVATMVARPPIGDIYPVVLHRDGVFVVWNISESDIANAGSGQYQLTFTDGEGDNAEIIKTVYGSFSVKPSMVSNGEAPDPIEDWLEEANEALAEFGKINELSASATTLEAGSEATAEITTVSGHKNIAIGVPKGDKGDKGDDGDPAPAEEVTAAVDAYLAENFSNPSNPPLDRSLSSSSSAAPADMVGDLKSALKSINDEYFLTFGYGCYQPSTTTAVGETITLNPSSTYVCAICKCQKNDIFDVHVYGGAGIQRAYYFCDANMVCIAKADRTNMEVNGKFVVNNDDNIAYVVFNNKLANLQSGYFAYKTTYIDRIIRNLQIENAGVCINNGKLTVSSDCFANGEINTSGEIGFSINRIITNMIPITPGSVISFTPGTKTAKMAYCLYHAGTMQFIRTASYINQSAEIMINDYETDGYYIIISCGKADNSRIEPSDYDATIIVSTASKSEVTLQMEAGAYSSSSNHYSKRISDYNNYVINKYPVLLNGAKRVVIKTDLDVDNIEDFKIRFADENEAIVNENIIDSNNLAFSISAANKVYALISLKKPTANFDINQHYIKLVGYGATEPIKETKRVYTNSNSEIVCLFDIGKDLFTGITLMLPPNYSSRGIKVPLVIWFDGNTNYSNITNGFSSNKLPGLTYVRDEGFAVMQVFSWGSYFSNKYANCGKDQPYPTPTCLKCIKAGIEYVCDRYNVDPDDVHIMSKSVGGVISTFFATHPIWDFKSIGMFAPVIDFLSMRGRYSDARKAIAEDMCFTGDHVEDFYDINFDGSTQTGVENYYFSERCQPVWQDNMPQLIRLNPAWSGLVGGTSSENYEKAISDSRTWWGGSYDSDSIYNHPEYKKTETVPVKIWAPKDDRDTPYKIMVELISQLRNNGGYAEIYSANGTHSVFDVATTYAQDITTVLGIEHEDVPLGWIENVKWIRQNSPKHT